MHQPEKDPAGVLKTMMGNQEARLSRQEELQHVMAAQMDLLSSLVKEVGRPWASDAGARSRQPQLPEPRLPPQPQVPVSAPPQPQVPVSAQPQPQVPVLPRLPPLPQVLCQVCRHSLKPLCQDCRRILMSLSLPRLPPQPQVPILPGLPPQPQVLCQDCRHSLKSLSCQVYRRSLKSLSCHVCHRCSQFPNHVCHRCSQSPSHVCLRSPRSPCRLRRSPRSPYRLSRSLESLSYHACRRCLKFSARSAATASSLSARTAAAASCPFPCQDCRRSLKSLSCQVCRHSLKSSARSAATASSLSARTAAASSCPFPCQDCRRSLKSLSCQSQNHVCRHSLRSLSHVCRRSPRFPCRLRGSFRTPCRLRGSFRTPCRLRGSFRTPCRLRGSFRTPCRLRGSSRTPCRLRGSSKSSNHVSRSPKSPNHVSRSPKSPNHVSRSPKSPSHVGRRSLRSPSHVGRRSLSVAVAPLNDASLLFTCCHVSRPVASGQQNANQLRSAGNMSVAETPAAEFERLTRRHAVKLLPAVDCSVEEAGLCGRAPGIDGLSVDFYKSFWPTVGPDLLAVMNDSIKNGKLPLSCRRAIITMLPKKGDLQDIKNWWPVSLLCSDYKILSKALALRLRGVMSSIIHPDQTYCSEALMVGEGLKDKLKLPGELEWKIGGFKYLGIFLGDETYKKKNWDNVLETVRPLS
ncbi:uncharacterized protein LOC144056610 [Vanacampus margaritifer]